MYGSTGGVNALVPTIGDLGAESTPTDTQVESWLEEATAMINIVLSDAGYSTDIDDSAALLPALDAMAQLYAAANVKLSRALDSNSGENENQSEGMFKRFNTWLKSLAGANLEILGLTLQTTTTRHRGFRTRQMRRVDGYSAVYEGSATPYDYPSE